MPPNELNMRKKQYVQELNGFIGLKKAYSGAAGQRAELLDGAKTEADKLSGAWLAGRAARLLLHRLRLPGNIHMVLSAVSACVTVATDEGCEAATPAHHRCCRRGSIICCHPSTAPPLADVALHLNPCSTFTPQA